MGVRSAPAPAFVLAGVADDGDVDVGCLLHAPKVGKAAPLILGLVFVAAAYGDAPWRRCQ
jgi:hypothetical protein